MIQGADIQAADVAIYELADQLAEIISHATSDQWKDSYVLEMGNFYELFEKMKEMGYEPAEVKKMSTKFDVHYYNSKGEETHKYEEVWSKTEYFCPNCDKQEVWFEDAEGACYVGEEHLCLACKSAFYLPMGVVDRAGDRVHIQRIEELQKVKK